MMIVPGCICRLLRSKLRRIFVWVLDRREMRAEGRDWEVSLCQVSGSESFIQITGPSLAQTWETLRLSQLHLDWQLLPANPDPGQAFPT